jgi:hypothetical protein
VIKLLSSFKKVAILATIILALRLLPKEMLGVLFIILGMGILGILLNMILKNGGHYKL